MFCITGNKIMRFTYVFLSLCCIGVMSFVAFAMIKFVPTCFPSKREALVVYGIGIASGLVSVSFIDMLIHMVFDKTYIDGNQIVVRTFYGKQWEYNVSDINKWSITRKHFRTYWDNVITVHIGKKYLDFHQLNHTKFVELWVYLEKHCPEKQVDIINHWW